MLARNLSRVLARHDIPHLSDLDSITGELLRATRKTTLRYERERLGELVHMDVKKLGRISHGGGWRSEGQTTHDPSLTREQDPHRLRLRALTRR